MSETGEGPKDPGRRTLIKAGAVGAAALFVNRWLGKRDKAFLEAASQGVPEAPKFPTPENPLLEKEAEKKLVSQKTALLKEEIANKFSGQKIGELSVTPVDEYSEKTAIYKVGSPIGLKVRRFPRVNEETDTGKALSFKDEFKVRFVVSYRTEKGQWDWGAVLLTDMDSNPLARPDKPGDYLEVDKAQYVFVCLKEDSENYAQRVKPDSQPK
jgi:hypothetical protein